ncbi:MAG: DUF4270 domain-containing protein [Pricia sp.]
MIFLNRIKFTAVAVIAFATLLTSCEEELTTIGSGVVGNEPFTTDKAVFDVFAVNKKIKAVRTNKLPIYQLGVFTDPVYGKTEATITSQVQLSSVNPLFGDERPADEATQENETVTSVVLYIPFLPSASGGDSDGDGLIDSEDSDPDDPNSNSDTDLLTDNQEQSAGTDPLNPDTDGDGINDDADDDYVREQFAAFVDVDSIYGNRELPFTLRLQRSDFFLRDLDPTTNFQEAQEYYSDQDFTPFLTDEIANITTSIDEKQILVPREDDPDTENVDESEQVQRMDPGIRVELPTAFFQENLLNKEGSSELLTQANFNEFLRGIHFSIEPAAGEDLMVLFDLKDAYITMSYDYTAEGETRSKDFRLNFITQQPRNAQTGQTFPVVGNAVNSFDNDDYTPEIAAAIASEENAERIYIKGDAGSFAEINLFDDANGSEAIAQIRANNWIINEASLVFYVDEAAGANIPPRLYLYSTASNLPLIGRNDGAAQNSSLASYPFYDGILEGEGAQRKYTVKITDYVNDLVIRNADNATLGLTFTPDIRIFNVASAMLADGTEADLPISATLSPLGTVLFGSAVSEANAGKRLQLEIFYTEAN